MPAILLDTSVLVRERDTSDPNHSLTISCVRRLWQSQCTLCITTQSLIEYWSVATRPTEARGGLGLSPQVVIGDIDHFLNIHEFVEEPTGILQQWISLVHRYQVRGKQVWDARLVAVMELLGIRHLLTFNKDDFLRYSSISVWNPSETEELLDTII